VDHRGAGVVGRLGEDRRSCTADRPGGWGAGAWNRRVGPARGTGVRGRRVGPAPVEGGGSGGSPRPYQSVRVLGRATPRGRRRAAEGPADGAARV